ncbi:unnamed protein product, partial [Rotaria sp. Silwood2]
YLMYQSSFSIYPHSQYVRRVSTAPTNKFKERNSTKLLHEI